MKDKMTKLVHLALLIVCGNFAWAQQPDSGNIKKKDTASGEVTQVTVAANAELKESGSSRFFIGKNYRPEWTTPITANVFQWNGAGGKIHPTKEGGGKQTKSL